MMDLCGNVPPTLVTVALAHDLEISLLPVVVPVPSPTCDLPSITGSSSSVVATTEEMITVISHPVVCGLSEIFVKSFTSHIRDTA